MELKRFFAKPENFDGANIVIDGEEFAHMTKVLRHKVGYRIIVSLDDGKDYFCTVNRIEKSYAVATVDNIELNECKTRAGVTLFQALPKGDKLDWIAQKCVELGVEKIAPFLSAYTNETRFNRDRLARIADEACKQCGRARRAEIGELTNFDGMLSQLKDFDLIIIPYEHAEAGRIGDVEGLDNANKIAVVIGSEGGFSAEEVEAVGGVGGRVVSLGKRILRCETAAIIAVGLTMYELKELGV